MKKAILIILVIIAVLLGYIAFNSNQTVVTGTPPVAPEPTTYTQTNQNPIGPDYQPQVKNDVVSQPQQNQKIVGLKIILKKDANININECIYQGKTFFAVSPTNTTDSTTVIYDISGVQVAVAGGMVASHGAANDALFKNIYPTCTKQIYHHNAQIYGTTDIDVYHINS